MLLLFMAPTGWFATAGAQETEAPDLYLRVENVVARLEQIRYHMGKPLCGEKLVTVSHASTREVFFLALTLCRKADRLCFEQLRERTPLPAVPDTPIQLSHCADALDGVAARIEMIETKLPADVQVDKQMRDVSKSLTDVFDAIVAANRQINILLEKQVSPSDVYQEVTSAISYASGLLAAVPGAVRNPDLPLFEPGKQPRDVLRRLIDCFGVMHRIAVHSDLEVLELKLQEGSGSEVAAIVPSDVFDISSLLVAELAHLHSRLPQAAPHRPAYYPGRKIPSDVFQRVGVLEAQLEQLENHSRESPDWIRDEQ